MSPKRGFDAEQLRRSTPGGGGIESLAITGRYLQGTWSVGSPVTGSSIADRLRFSPWWIWEELVVDRIGVHVTVAQATGSTRIGIYESDSAGIPSKLLVDAGTIDSSTTGFKEITIAEILLGQRLYWACFVNNVGSIDLRGAAGVTASSVGRTAGSDVNGIAGLTMVHSFAALPDPATSVVAGGGNHEVRLRVA